MQAFCLSCRLALPCPACGARLPAASAPAPPLSGYQPLRLSRVIAEILCASASFPSLSSASSASLSRLGLVGLRLRLRLRLRPHLRPCPLRPRVALVEFWRENSNMGRLAVGLAPCNGQHRERKREKERERERKREREKATERGMREEREDKEKREERKSIERREKRREKGSEKRVRRTISLCTEGERLSKKWRRRRRLRHRGSSKAAAMRRVS